MSDPAREGWILFAPSGWIAVPATVGAQVINAHLHMDSDYHGENWTIKGPGVKMMVMTADQMDVIRAKARMLANRPKDPSKD